jgi:ATP-binding cassette subfamily B protein
MKRSIHPLWRLLRYGQRYGSIINQAIACSVLNKFFDLAPPVLIGWAVDILIEKERSFLGRLGITDVVLQLVILSFVSAIIWGLESLFEYAYARLWRNVAQSMQHDLRIDAYTHLQEMELAFFEERSTGELMSILSDDINQLERFLDGGANEILQVSTTVLLIGAVFIYLSPVIAVWSAIPIPFILWGSIKFQSFLAPLYADVREKVSALNSQLSNNLSGIVTIKAFTREDFEIDRITKESDRYRESNRRAIKYSAAFVPLIRILVFVGFITILFFGGLEVYGDRLSVGNYSVMVFLTQRLLWPLTRLGETLDHYQRAMASTVRVMNLLDTPIAVVSGDKPILPEQIRGEVSITNVSFQYKEGIPVLKNLSLHIPAGQTIGIVGATGSGKSTLVKLLLRLYEVPSGEITIDGISIRDFNLRNLRRCIGWVSQDIFLFHGTVLENIAYGRLSASREEIIASAKIAEAHDFILQLPHGYDTIVGERGQKLSGGQKQRIAIARAILRNPPILILDEATSALDNETELAIQNSLRKITNNRTTIAIAHRLSTIRHADCIYVMDQGEIVETGTHEELLAQNGIYRNLWDLQVGN